MRNAVDTYLGWEPFPHLKGCTATTVDFQHRTTDRRFSNTEELDVRAVCRRCGVVQLLNATTPYDDETYHVRTDRVTTDYIGYGRPPLRRSGLWVWPGPRVDRFGRRDNPPLSYLATQSPATPRTREDVVGAVLYRSGPRGGDLWDACLGIDPPTLNAPHPFRSEAAGFKWIAAQLAANNTDTTTDAQEISR
jgi:hypothetical protein